MRNIIILEDKLIGSIVGGIAAGPIAVDTPGGIDLYVGTPAGDAFFNLPLSVRATLIDKAGFSIDRSGTTT